LVHGKLNAVDFTISLAPKAILWHIFWTDNHQISGLLDELKYPGLQQYFRLISPITQHVGTSILLVEGLLHNEVKFSSNPSLRIDKGHIFTASPPSSSSERYKYSHTNEFGLYSVILPILRWFD